MKNVIKNWGRHFINKDHVTIRKLLIMAKRSRSCWEQASWIAGVLSAILAVISLLYTWFQQGLDSPVPPISQVAGENSTQIANVFGTVIVNTLDNDEQAAQTKPIAIDYRIFRGVSEAFMSYNKGGIVGVGVAVDDCYSGINNESSMEDVEQCLAMDLTGHYWDNDIAAFMNYPLYDYFSELKVLNRLETAFSNQGAAKSIWENFVFKVWVPQIKEQYAEIAEKNAPR